MGLQLYRVICRGASMSDSYVIANDPAEAYRKVRYDLIERDIGFDEDRELKCIELLAEKANYPDCGAQLYI